SHKIIRSLGADFAQSKLQNYNSLQRELSSQLFHFGNDISKIFSDERQRSQFLSHDLEKVHAGTIHPSSLSGSGVRSWNTPEFNESSKMIDPKYVNQLKSRAKPVNPPFVFRLFE